MKLLLPFILSVIIFLSSCTTTSCSQLNYDTWRFDDVECEEEENDEIEISDDFFGEDNDGVLNRTMEKVSNEP